MKKKKENLLNWFELSAVEIKVNHFCDVFTDYAKRQDAIFITHPC